MEKISPEKKEYVALVNRFTHNVLLTYPVTKKEAQEVATEFNKSRKHFLSPKARVVSNIF